MLELTQDYLMYVYDILKKFQKKRKNANTQRFRHKEGQTMAKGSHPGRKKTPQYPGKKFNAPSQPQISSFFYPLKKISNVIHVPIFPRQPPPY